jgi:hypothetical protein
LYFDRKGNVETTNVLNYILKAEGIELLYCTVSPETLNTVVLIFSDMLTFAVIF